MPILSRLATGLLAGVIALAAVAPAVFAQEASAPSPLAALSGSTELRQVSGATVTDIKSVAAIGMLAEDAVTWKPQGGLEAILTVQSQEEICPPAKPGMVTCLAIGFKSYEIRVTGRTTKLAKDRSPLTEEILVGDRVNAYGAFDVSTGRMDAQIVRDLDKPFSPRVVQLDGLRVIGVTQGKDGIQVDAVHGSGPCWNYRGGARLTYPCPAGTQPAPYVRAMVLPGYDVSTVYSIAVPRTAAVLDVDRRTLDPSSVSAGDVINVYGRLTGSGMMQAQVLRVVSDDVAPASAMKMKVLSGSANLDEGEEAAIELQVVGGSAPYTWSVTGLPEGITLESQGIVYCIKAPCPQPATDAARITGASDEEGTYDVTVEVADAAGAGKYLTFPLTVGDDSGAEDDEDASPLEVSVVTDRSSYRADQTVDIRITVANPTRDDQSYSFNGGCAADYDVLPGFSLRTLRLCAASLGTVRLDPGESRTYSFEHDLSTHAMPRMAFPFDLTVVGRVTGAGEAKTTIRVTSAR